MEFLKKLWKDENGAVATEYVILVGLMAIVLIGVITAFKDRLFDLWNTFLVKMGGEKESTSENIDNITE